MIDPPSGWKYGFPKPIPANRRDDVQKWLVEEGYPQEEIDKLEGCFICRIWEEPDEKPRAILKFNGGNLALLCSKCSVIVKTGKDFTDEELNFVLSENKHLDPVYCSKCKQVNNAENLTS